MEVRGSGAAGVLTLSEVGVFLLSLLIVVGTGAVLVSEGVVFFFFSASLRKEKRKKSEFLTG